MLVYYPVAPYTKREDWHGAYKAVPNAANTAWEPRLTEEGTHHDYELGGLLPAIGNMFGKLLAQYQVDSIKATDDASRSVADLKYVTVAEFWSDVEAEGRKLARSLYLGQRVVEAHPTVGYIDADSTKAIETVRARWMATRGEDMGDLSEAFRFIRNYLDMPSVELPWEYRARISNANLKALKVESRGDGSQFGPLDVGTFHPDTMNYAASVANGVTTVRIAPTVMAAGATVKVGRADSLVDLGAGNSLTLTLATGANVFNIEVTAIDGKTTETYTVTVTRAA